MFHVHVSSASCQSKNIVPNQLSQLDGGTRCDGGDTEHTSDTSAELSFSVGALNVDVIHGNIQLFRQQGVPVGEALGCSRSLAVIAVPAHISFADFVSFVGPYSSAIEHMRIVRDAVKAMGRFMVLIRFSTQEAADGFYRGFNGKPFSSFDTHVAHVVYVAHVKFTVSDKKTASPATAAPAPCDDPSDAAARLNLLASDPLKQEDQRDTDPSPLLPEMAADERRAGAWQSTESPCGSEALVELPTCPVCLERLEASVSGILTTICNHTFHCSCLSRWQDDTCPVCRYCFADEFVDEETSPACEACGAIDNLWMCLVCGHIGCGRYSREHAIAHYRTTGHTYSIDLETQRVWDYAGDGYVHRLIQNKTDGKLVEVPDLNATSDDRTCAEDRMVSAQKAEAIAFEYTMLLTSQLEVQRQFYESLLIEMASLLPTDDEDKLSAAQAIIWRRNGLQPSSRSPHFGAREGLLERRNRGSSAHSAGTASHALLVDAMTDELMRSKVDEYYGRSVRLQSALDDVTKEKKAIAKHCEDLSAKAMQQAEEIAFLRDVNDTLTKNQRGWEDKCVQLEKEKEAIAADAGKRVQELEEQVRDLMFFLDSQKKFSDVSEDMKRELQAGHVLITTEGKPARNHRTSSSAAASSAITRANKTPATAEAVAVTPPEVIEETPSILATGARKHRGKGSKR